ncbi:uncharacterized protein LOC107411614 isoform X2 [Ziziphus jujuba]|uniref:Small ribosomal subunit protein mS29 n=1 Tax=Ziziphus jujuba TaxID=326968 RepID=A0ABM3IAL8_ZIZJJ|nr:uncharacterized protein LOC107411614 isoform X2 [Ziziphus jujuba]
MLRSVLRGKSATGLKSAQPWSLSWKMNYAAKNTSTKSNVKKAKKTKSKGDADASSDAAAAAERDVDAALFDDNARARRLAADENNPELDAGPNGRPLFTSTPSLSQLTRKDTCSYYKFKMEELNEVLPEGLPMGMVKEFEESMRSALLIRQSFLDLRDNYRRIVDPPLWLPSSKGVKIKKQMVLDGHVSCGKSIVLAMLVHWARDEGWLVFYVPRGWEWTHGGFFYKNPQTDLWDTPVQAENVLKDFLKFNESHLKKLPCQILDPIPLGEGAGVGWMKDGIDSMTMPEGSSLYDLVDTGIKHTHAAVGVVVRLRKELSLVKDIPVLIAIDQYNNWFTFSEYEEAVTVRSTRPIHARELAMLWSLSTNGI